MMELCSKGAAGTTLMLALILAGCRPQEAPEAEFFASVPSDGWTETNVFELSSDMVPQGDSVPFCRARLTPPALWIRYSLNASESLPVVLLAEGFEMESVSDTLRISLFDSDRPLGKGQRGLFELSVPLPPELIPFRGSETGDSVLLPQGWRLTLYPLAPVSGISELGVSF